MPLGEYCKPDSENRSTPSQSFVWDTTAGVLSDFDVTVCGNVPLFNRTNWRT